MSLDAEWGERDEGADIQMIAQPRTIPEAFTKKEPIGAESVLVEQGPGSGLQFRVLTGGVDLATGFSYVDIHLAGKAKEKGNLYLTSLREMPSASEGESWSSVVSVGLVRGISPTQRIGLYFYDENRKYLPGAGGGQSDLDVVPRDVLAYGLDLQRTEWTALATDSRVRFVRQHLWLNGLENGQLYDFVLRIGAPRLQKRTQTTLRTIESPSLDSVPAKEPLVTSKSQVTCRLLPSSEHGKVINDYLQAPVLPLRVPNGQSLQILGISDGLTEAYLPHIRSNTTVHTLLTRCNFPFAECAEYIVAELFRKNPDCTRIRVSRCLDNLNAVKNSTHSIDRTTFVLPLPDSFESFRMKSISSKLRLHLGRHERRLMDTIPNYKLSIFEGETLTYDIFQQIVTIVSNRLRERAAAEGNLNWQDPHTDTWTKEAFSVYKTKGFAVAICDGETLAAVAVIGGRSGDDFHFTLSGYDSAYGKYSISSVLLYRTIEIVMGRGARRFHLGGGDFGYKSRFGAIEMPLFNVEILK